MDEWLDFLFCSNSSDLVLWTTNPCLVLQVKCTRCVSTTSVFTPEKLKWRRWCPDLELHATNDLENTAPAQKDVVLPLEYLILTLLWQFVPTIWVCKWVKPHLSGSYGALQGPLLELQVWVGQRDPGESGVVGMELRCLIRGVKKPTLENTSTSVYRQGKWHLYWSCK